MTSGEELGEGALTRLQENQRFDLDNLCASLELEGQYVSAAAREFGAAYLLDEISFEELNIRLANQRFEEPSD